MKKISIAVVGLGNQAIEDHLPTVTNSPYHELSAICDINDANLNLISSKFRVDGFSSYKELAVSKKPDVVILALPHCQYLEAISVFASQGIHIIKEKPFATNINEAINIDSIIKQNNVFLGITLQRRFDPIFKTFHRFRHRIGKIFFIDGVYGLNIEKLDEGWRANKNSSKGGALTDMGYHFIDLLVWYMGGIPNSITARFSRGNRENQEYDVEDTAHLMFEYIDGNYHEKTIGRFLISRVSPKKEEYIIFYGTKGSIKIERERISVFCTKGEIIDCQNRKEGKTSVLFDQLVYFTNIIQGKSYDKYSHKEHFQHVSILEACYESDANQTSVKPTDYYNKFI
jgi:predicted dehydrogenase